MSQRQKLLPLMYYRDINENTTRYEVLLASAPDDQRLIMWKSWAGVALATSLLCGVVMVAILQSPKARRNIFNWYLIYLIIPDIIFSLNCGITCLINAVLGQFLSEWMCHYQSFYCIFGISANAWLNALIARQLFLMLESSGTFRQYSPPTLQQVTIQASVVYLFSALLGALPLLHNIIPWLPHQSGLMIGVACLPVATSVGSEVFFFLVFCPLLVVIPLGFVLWVFVQIFCVQKLLPPTGRRRLLAVYFLRLAVVFVVMWVPGVGMLYLRGKAGTTRWSSPWVSWMGGTWSHLQGSVSALVSLLKPDVKEAVYDFTLGNMYYYCGCLFGCCCCRKPESQCQGNKNSNNDDGNVDEVDKNNKKNNSNHGTQSGTRMTKSSLGVSNFDSLFGDQSHYDGFVSRFNSFSGISGHFSVQEGGGDTAEEQQEHNLPHAGGGYSLASSILTSHPMVDLEGQQHQERSDGQSLVIPTRNRISSVRFSSQDETAMEECNSTTKENDRLPIVVHQYPQDDGKDRLPIVRYQNSKLRDRLPIQDNQSSSMEEGEDRFPMGFHSHHHDSNKDDDNNNEDNNGDENKDTKGMKNHHLTTMESSCAVNNNNKD